ncbi:MAG: hypothetical protein P8X97_04720 [Candidatus Bathyarchaeota archaeon]
MKEITLNNNNKKTPILEVSDLYVSRSNSVIIEDASFTINKGDYVGYFLVKKLNHFQVGKKLHMFLKMQ